MFSLLLRLQIVTIFVPGCTGWLCQMGLIVVIINHLVIVLQQPILIGWDCNVALNNVFHEKNSFLLILLPSMQICLI